MLPLKDSAYLDRMSASRKLDSVTDLPILRLMLMLKQTTCTPTITQ